MRAIGIMLIMIFNLIIITVSYTYFYKTIFIFYRAYKRKYIPIILVIIGVTLLFNTLFNYWMAILIKPGYSENFEELREE